MTSAPAAPDGCVSGKKYRRRIVKPVTDAFRPWRLAHVDLADGIAEPFTDDVAGLFVVFWLREIPLGHLALPPGSAPRNLGQLKDHIANAVAPAVGYRMFGEAFRAPLPLRPHMSSPPPTLALEQLVGCTRPLETLGSASSGAPPEASTTVIVCTHDRPERLRTCLASLAAQDVPPMETIVVDNDPASGRTQPVVASFAGAHYVAEPRPGLSIARNTGLHRARGDIVAFTDDDVQVHRGWLRAIEHVFRDAELSAVTGLMLPTELETPAQLAFQLNGHGWGYRALTFDPEFFRKMSGIGAPVWRIGAGANMAFRRRVFEEVGLFDERLGAGAAGCSEDSELWYRLLATGKRIRYDPAAVVFHTHRETADELREQMYAYMKGHVAALLFQHQRHAHRGNLYRVFLELPAYYIRKTAARLLRGRVPFALPITAQLRGSFAGLWYYLLHRAEPAWTAPAPPKVDGP